MTDFASKRTLVTGAAMGMGRKMAERFAAEGAELILVDIDEDQLEATRLDLERSGYDVHSYLCDLSERTQIDELRDRIHDDLGPLDILVNNAGIVVGGVYEEMDERADDLMIDVNARAVHWMTKTFLPDLKASADAHLIQMASAAGFVGVPYQVTYCATKWYVIGMSEALRQELRLEGLDHVGVTIVCPSLVDTGMFEGSKAPLFAPTMTPDYVVDRIVEAVHDDALYVKEPFMVKMTPLLRALLPTELVDMLLDQFGATSIMHGWKGREE
jgi:short-subunit dehydrogenase